MFERTENAQIRATEIDDEVKLVLENNISKVIFLERTKGITTFFVNIAILNNGRIRIKKRFGKIIKIGHPTENTWYKVQ